MEIITKTSKYIVPDAGTPIWYLKSDVDKNGFHRYTGIGQGRISEVRIIEDHEIRVWGRTEDGSLIDVWVDRICIGEASLNKESVEKQWEFIQKYKNALAEIIEKHCEPECSAASINLFEKD